MGLFGRSRSDKLGQAIGIDDLREQVMAEDPSYMPPAQNKMKFFDGQGGGIGSLILGSIGDAIAQRSGFAPSYGPLMQFRREQELEDQRYQRRQDAELAQRKAMFDYERANPAPRYFEANNGDQFMIDPDGQPKLVYHDPTPKVQWQRVENGDGTFTMVPIVNGQIAGGAGKQVPAAPVGKLRPYGGPSQPATGGFPGR